jgi:hypothetical protein
MQQLKVISWMKRNVPTFYIPTSCTLDTTLHTLLGNFLAVGRNMSWEVSSCAGGCVFDELPPQKVIFSIVYFCDIP